MVHVGPSIVRLTADAPPVTGAKHSVASTRQTRRPWVRASVRVCEGQRSSIDVQEVQHTANLDVGFLDEAFEAHHVQLPRVQVATKALQVFAVPTPAEQRRISDERILESVPRDTTAEEVPVRRPRSHGGVPQNQQDPDVRQVLGESSRDVPRRQVDRGVDAEQRPGRCMCERTVVAGEMGPGRGIEVRVPPAPSPVAERRAVFLDVIDGEDVDLAVREVNVRVLRQRMVQRRGARLHCSGDEEVWTPTDHAAAVPFGHAISSDLDHRCQTP